MKSIFERAAERNVYLEINSHPERTDLNDADAIEAKKAGCSFVIDTDVHSTSRLEYAPRRCRCKKDVALAFGRNKHCFREDASQTI